MCMVAPPPFSRAESLVDVLHGVPVADPYRWLEHQNSPETRAWIEEQTRYARAYLDNIPRDQIRKRVRELLDVETYDSFLKSGRRYFFRKRLLGREQPSIYLRECADGEDQLLVNPAERVPGPYTAVKPLRVSPDGSLLLYEVKHGGERMGTFEILDVANRKTLPDSLPRGYLRGFAFAPDGRSFYYVHEEAESKRPFYRAACHHTLGSSFESDREIFFAGEDEKLRLALVAGRRTLGFLVYRFLEKTCTDFHIQGMGSTGASIPVLRDANFNFGPRLIPGRIIALTDENAPNRRIVEVQVRKKQDPLYFNLIPESDAPIQDWTITANYLLVMYLRGTRTQAVVFDLFGKRIGEIPFQESETVRLLLGSSEDDEVFFEHESFTRPTEIKRCALDSGKQSSWARRSVPFDPTPYESIQPSFSSKDGTSIPMFLTGRRESLRHGTHPTIVTSYGGYGIPSTPQFSVLVAFLLEQGCLFALPSIRGGSEFGAGWHHAARRRHRQVAFDDFLSAVDWLVETGRTTPNHLAIFGGSNSGLLVAAAMTQRPELFRAVLCMVPILDMLRYQLFDHARSWTNEFGTTDDAEDFRALLAYSPYHAVRDNTSYPATMIVSGDADQSCNALHARKMTARLQGATSSSHPIILDYNLFRGHAPVLPLTTRVEALTDRLAFLSDQLGLACESR
jgi:prolyl oligopeptidase